MTQSVNVPGVGTLQFPDGMSQADMAAAIQKNFPQIHPPKASGTSPPTISQELSAPFEAAASLGTQALAPFGASIENLVTGHTSPADYAAARAKWAYTPTNPVAQQDISAVTWLPRHTIGPVVNKVSNWVAEHSHGLMSPLEAQDTANTALAALMGPKAGNTEAVSTLAPEVRAVTGKGLNLTPTQAGGGVLSRAAEGISGSAKLERVNSIKNAPKVNALAASDIGAASLKPADVDAAAAPALAVYRAVRHAGNVKLNPNDFDAVTASGTLKDPAVQALQAHYANMGSIDAKDLVADVRQLRAAGNKNKYAPYAPERNDLGSAQLQAANSLEDALDRHLQGMDDAPVSIEDYRNARTQLAKIADVRRSMRGSNLSPKALAKSGDKLTGNLKTIGDAYRNFDRSFQDVSKIRDNAPLNFADLLVGGLGALPLAMHHPLGALAAIPGVLARPTIRSLLASPMVQRSLAGGAPVAAGIPGLLGPVGAASPLLNQPPPRGLLQ